MTAEVEASVVFSLYGGDSTDGGDKLVNNGWMDVLILFIVLGDVYVYV